MIDVGTEAQQAAERHLAACWEALEATGDEAQTPAAAPFCGCETCCVRETLNAAWPVFERWARDNGSVRAELLALVEEYAQSEFPVPRSTGRVCHRIIEIVKGADHDA